jgi:predicted PurR-regulated permease PerM
MYHYDSNGQKMPMNGQMKAPVKAKENYGSDGGSGSSSSKKNMWIWIGLGVAVVVILVVVFMMLRSKKGSASTSSGVMGMHRGSAHMGAQRWGFRFY